VRHALGWIAVAYGAGILLADREALPLDAARWLGAIALVLGLSSRRARFRAALLLGLCTGALVLGGRIQEARRGRPVGVVEATIEASVREVRRGASGYALDLIDVVALSGAAVPVRVHLLDDAPGPAASRLASARPGERLRARVRLRAPHSLRNPGARRSPRERERAGVGAIGRLVHPALVSRIPEREGIRPLAPIHAARARWGERLAAAGVGGGLLGALALGDRAALPEPTRRAFASLGIAHILAVSGLHLALAAGWAFALLRGALSRSVWLCARCDVRLAALAGALLAALLYALLAGFGVPVRRALVFLAATVLALFRGRSASASACLGGAALVVLGFEPDALFRAGPQLSFAAAAALCRVTRTEIAGGGVRVALLATLNATAAAAAATAPIAAWHMGGAAPFALPVNMVFVPWTGLVLLPAALIATLAVALPTAPGAEFVLDVAERLAARTLDLASVLAALAPARATTTPAPAWLALAALLSVATVMARRTPARLAGASILGVLLALAPTAPIAPPVPRLVALDVGQGDAVLLQGRRATLLVDAGTAIPGGVDLGERVVVPALQALGVARIDVLVATHADLDHRGGIPAVLAALPVGEVWLPPGGIQDAGFAGVLAAARRARAPVLERGTGSPALAVGDLRITPLWPPRSQPIGSRNDASLAIRVEMSGQRVLLLGDLEAVAESALVGSGADLRADVLVLPHHGSRTSSSPMLLRAVAPTVSVASAPCIGRFGMPHPSVRERLREAGAPVWWTGRDGAVRIRIGDRLAVLPFAARREGCGESD
jgi:competence protein ComEC